MTEIKMSNPSLRRFALTPLLLLFACFFAQSATGQSKVFGELTMANQSGINLYFYPSTVRVLAKTLLAEDADALSGVRKARVAYTSIYNTEFSEAVERVVTHQKAEGFEELMRIKNGGMGIRFYMRDGKDPGALLFMNDDLSQYAIEVTGTVTFEALMRLMQTDLSGTARQFGIMPDNAEDRPMEEITAPAPEKEFENE